MALCPISIGNAFSCAANEAKGLYSPSVWLYNLDEWKLATLTTGADDQITDITNASGDQAYLFSTDKASNFKCTVAQRTAENTIDGWDNSVIMPLSDIGAAEIKDLKNLVYGKFVAIVFMKNGEGQVYGSNVGLRATGFDFDVQTGMVVITATTDAAEAPEITPYVVIDATSFALTKTLIEGLTTPGA